MCLSIAIHRPNDVLGTGHYRGYEWMVIHNHMGYRCGYARVPKGHPWHGKDFAGSWDENDNPPSVHGGITFSRPDVPCGKGGADDAWWHGFDAAHSGDAQDPTLPRTSGVIYWGDLGGIVRTQEYVEAECRSLIDQAVAAAEAVGFVAEPDDHHHETCEVAH